MLVEAFDKQNSKLASAARKSRVGKLAAVHFRRNLRGELGCSQ
jgi:hypothetical protein